MPLSFLRKWARLFFVATLLVSQQSLFSQVCATTDLPANLQTGLLAFYPFCGNANNALGTGNNGTVYNATLTTDRYSNANAAYSFNGTNAYIDFGTNSSIGPTTTIPLSISLWVSAGSIGTAISKYTNLTAAQSFFYFSRSADGYQWVGNGTNPYFNNTGVTDNAWTHYVLVGVNGTNNSKVYRNGVLIATGTLAMNTTMQAVSLLVGKVGASPSNFFTGSVDEVLIYNRELTACEAQQLYQFTSATSSAGTLSGTQTVCIGGTTTFSSTVSGGTWSSSATSTATVVANTGVVTGVAAGTATMTYTITGCSSVTSTRTVTVSANNTAGAASSTPTLCINTALTAITHTTTGATGIGTATGLPTGVTAAWASNRITISGTPTQSGTFNYSIPLTGGCGSVNATGTITVTAANTASTPSTTPTLCINTALTAITHTTTGATGIGTATGLPAGVTAAWASNRITISGTPTQSGTFNYTIPLTGGCGSISASGTITVAARPVAGTLDGVQAICALGSTTFSSTSAGGSWSSSDNTVATIDASTGVITGIAAGTATMTYTMTGTGGCANATATRTVTVTAIPTTGTLSGTQAICIGGTSTFSSTVTGGSWLSSDNTIVTIDATTGAVAGIAAGTATMTYTVTGTGGCADVSATRTVTVTAPPSAGLLSGPQDICVLGTTTLTSTVAGGSWSSSATGVATINATTGVATGVAAGIATMTYTVAGTGGCANVSATRNVTVTAAPSAGTLSGTQAICVSGSVLFSSTAAGGSWTSSNALIASINTSTGAVTGVAPGVATMTYVVTGTGGCANVSATRSVTVTAAPSAGTLSGTQALCISGTTTFSSSVSGGTWTSSSTPVATINGSSGFVLGVTAGSATMTYTVLGTGGCSNATATRTVTVTAAPVAGTLSGTPTICISGTTTLSSSATGGSWTSSNGSIATINASTGFVTGIAAGTATMTYTVLGTGGCANATATRVVTVSAPPSAGTLSGTQAICVGGSSSFSSSIAGGTWTSSDNTIATINTTTGFIAGLTAGTVTMTYTVIGTGGCADATATRTITMTTPPVAGTLSGTQTICITGTTVFTSSVAGGTWTSSDNTVAVVNATSGIVTGVAAGNTTITYTVAGTGGCANVTATRTITVNPNNTVGQASAAPTLCINTSLIPITHTTTGATDIGVATGLPAGVSASWASNRITISGTPTVAGTFDYSIPLIGGCGAAVATGTIIVRPVNTVSVASSTPTLCINTPLIPITHTTTGAIDIGVPVGLPTGVTASWLAGVITISGTPTSSGTYNYSIPLVGGCGSLSATGVIIVAPLPSGTVTSSTNLLCDGGTVPLTATGGATYQWFLNGGIIVGATGGSLAANQPGTYTVNVVSSFGCIAPAVGSVTLQLVRKPTVNFTYDKYCAGFPTLFTDQSNTANSNVVTYSWNFGQGQGTSTLQNPTNTYAAPGNYSASLTITPVACPSLATSFTKTVTIVAPPANQRYTSLNAVENRDIQLDARTFSGSTYSWAPATGLSSATIASPVFNYTAEVEYVVTITTGIGCVVKDTQLVRLFKEKEFYVPKGFSPNGDGNNDKIFPRLVGVRSLTSFKVFNRWGQLVFETSTINDGWDGKFRGINQPMEGYVWVAEGIDIDNNIIKRSGTFLLVR